MLSNLAYTFLKIDLPLEAVQAFNDVTEATFRSTIGLAYSQFKAKQYENAYSVYESALEWLATNDRQKALILVAMSSMVYAFQGESDAKTVLFQWFVFLVFFRKTHKITFLLFQYRFAKPTNRSFDLCLCTWYSTQ